MIHLYCSLGTKLFLNLKFQIHSEAKSCIKSDQLDEEQIQYSCAIKIYKKERKIMEEKGEVKAHSTAFHALYRGLKYSISCYNCNW